MPYPSAEPKPLVHVEYSDTKTFNRRCKQFNKNKYKTYTHKYEYEEQIEKNPNDLSSTDESDSDTANYFADQNAEQIPIKILYQKPPTFSKARKYYSAKVTENQMLLNDNKSDITRSNANSLLLLMQYCAIAFLAFLVVYGFLVHLNKINDNTFIERRMCSFKSLEKKFPNQESIIWNYLKFGVEGLLNNESIEPKVYLFLHDNNIKSRILINEIAQTSSACFDPSLTPVRLEKQDFLSDDYGSAIEKYKSNINDGGVLIVVNLNEIPPKNARALHAICDVYTPIAKRVLILLTLAVENLNDKKVNVMNTAHNKLTKIWGEDLKENELNPLITRVTDNVFRLNSE